MASTETQVEGHGSPITLDNGAVLYNDDRPHGKSGKGGVVKAHGTSTGYQRGCHCDECKQAMADYTAKRREASKDTADDKAKAKAEKAAKAKARREAKKAEKEQGAVVAA